MTGKTVLRFVFHNTYLQVVMERAKADRILDDLKSKHQPVISGTDLDVENRPFPWMVHTVNLCAAHIVDYTETLNLYNRQKAIQDLQLQQQEAALGIRGGYSNIPPRGWSG